MKRWILRLFQSPAPRSNKPTRPRLNLLPLEDRITPADFRDVGGLRFFTPDGTFSPSGSSSTISTNVQVGLTPTTGTFVPLLDLPGGTTVSTSPISATVNSTIRVGGVTFSGNNLAFAFDTPNKTFTLSGGASFSAGGITIAGQFGSAGSATPGLVIQNGKLASLDLGITSAFSFGGVSFQSNDLRFKLDTANGNRFALSGGASAKFQGAGSTINIATRFGDSAQKPGLVVVNGQLTELAVGITGNFKVAGLEASANDLTFRYKAAEQSFGLSGTVRISTAPVSGGRRVLDNFGVTLGQGIGSTATPGLLVRGGSLETIDFTLNGAINLGSLSVMPSNLRVRYTRDTSLLQITGSLTVSLGAQFNATADLNNGGLAINTSTGAVQLNGFRISLNETRFGPVLVRNAFVAYRNNGNGGFDLTGGAVVDLPAGITVDGGFMFANGSIDRIRIAVSKSPGIQIPGTPIFISRIEADLMNLSLPSQLRLVGTVTFTAGGSFRIGGTNVSLLQGTTSITLDVANSRLLFDGAVSLIGTAIPVSNATVTIQFSPSNPLLVQSVRAFTNLRLYFGFVEARIELDLRATGDATYTFRTTVQVPSFTIPRVFIPSVQLVPPISFGLLGTTPAVNSPEITLIPATTTPRIPLANATVTLRLSATDPRSSSFTFSGDILSFITANFRVSFDGNVSVQGGVNVPGLGTANLPAINFNIGQLFPNVAPTIPPPPPPAAPSGYSPTVRITSVTRTTNGRGVVVSFQGSTIDPASAVARFNYADGRTVATVNLASPGSGQTFNRSNGIGSFTIPDVVADNLILPTFSLRGSIQDRFASTSSDLFGPVLVLPPNYAPTVQITGTSREADGRLRIDFQASSFDSFPTFQFDNNTPQNTGNGTVSPTTTISTFRTTFPSSSSSYNTATGRGFVIVADPQETIAAGRPFTIVATVQDRFASGRSATFGPVATAITTPLTVTAPTTLNLAVGSTTAPFAIGSNRYRISDPVRSGGADSIVTLVIRSETPDVTFALTRPLPASIVVDSEPSNGRYVQITGRLGQVNSVVDQLNVRRVSVGRGELRFFALRSDLPNDISGSVDRSVAIPSLPIFVAFPSLNVQVTANQSPVNPLGTELFGRTTIQSENIFFNRASITVRRLDGSEGSERLALSSPYSFIAVRSSANGRTLDITGFGGRDQYQDLLNRFTLTSTGPLGAIAFDIRLVDASERIGTATYERFVFVPSTAGQLPEGGEPDLPPADPFPGLVLRVGGVADYDGTGPSAVFPGIVASNDTGNPVRSATVAFTGFYDSTSDRLLFDPVGDIAGDFDIPTGVLSLTAGPAATLADFEATLRTVRFDSLRRNAMTLARQVTATLFTDVENSAPEFGTVSVQMIAPIVPPVMAGSTDPLTAAPDGSPVPMFADMTMTDPDAAMPAPAFVLGEFMMGSTMTRGTVQIANFVPGEDLLTFESTGGITGDFNEETGELSFFGQGTMAEWQQVMQSIQYENLNASPTPGERMIVVTMDDGSASGNPPTMTRMIEVPDTDEPIVRSAGTVNAIDLAPGSAAVSLGLEGLAYAPRPGEPVLVFTILSAPGDGQGTVLLADGTPAVAGIDVTLDQLRGATFVPDETPPSGAVPFSFQVAGINAVTGQTTDEPLIETVSIRTANVAPVAVADSFTVPAYTPFSFNPAGNDSDANGDLLRIQSFTQPQHGLIEIADGITLTYRPNPGYTGDDSFVYTVADAAGDTASRTVDLRVIASTRAANILGTSEFAVGDSSATLFNGDGTARFSLVPFPGFGGEIRTATADFTGDGIADLVVGTGPGATTQVKIFDGSTQGEIFSLIPFESTFTGGIFVTAGDLDGDGAPDLAVTPDNGGGPRVLVYRGTDMVEILSFFAIDDANFRGGARAAIADMTGDGIGDLIVVAGTGGGPRVAAFDGTSLVGTPRKIFGDFFAFEQSLRDGIYIAAGDLNGDGFADLIAGGGPGGGPRVLAFDGRSLLTNEYKTIANFFAGDEQSRSGVRLAVKNLDNDGRADLVIAAGDGTNAKVVGYLGSSVAESGTPIEEFELPTLSGTFIG